MTYSYDEAREETLTYFNGDNIATDVFLKKYALKNEKGELLEKSPDDMHKRLAKEFARIERKYDNPLSEDEIYNLFEGFKWVIPQGSPMSAIGNNYKVQSSSNCFVVPSPTDSYGGILRTDQEQAQIMKRRGGVGFDISTIRPSGASTANAAGTSDGIGVFMERFSNTCREVAQSGRRGALLISISVHHPDIETFVKIKRDLKKVTGANISIRITDEFMKAVQKDTDVELRFPVEKDAEHKIKRKVKAKELWDEIITSARDCAEPGLLFWDNVQNNTPTDCYKEEGYESVSTNPCCFDKDSDVFVITKAGIKEIKDITSEDLIWVDSEKMWAKTSGYFDAGTADVYKVTLSNNEVLFITENHKLETLQKNDRTYDRKLLQLKDISIGDKIACHQEVVNDFEFSNKGTFDEGIVLGWLTGDGTTYKKHKEDIPSIILPFWPQEYDVADKMLDIIRTFDLDNKLTEGYCARGNLIKKITSRRLSKKLIDKYGVNLLEFKHGHNSFLEECSKEFLSGYLNSYFSADGTVSKDQSGSRFCIQLGSIDFDKLTQIKNILLLFGISSQIGLSIEAREGYNFGVGGIYDTKNLYRLTITGYNNLVRFNREIGLISSYKQVLLQNIVDSYRRPHKSKIKSTKVVSIENVGPKEVGCIEVNEHHKFTANGIISGNSEIVLSPYDSCRLMVVNLFNFVNDPFTSKAKFDFEKFADVSRKAQKLMDDMIDIELECIDKIIKKVKSDPEPNHIKKTELDLWTNIKKAAENGRRTGLGITALGDTIAALDIKYGTKKSINVVEEIYKTLAVSAYESSVDMAKDRGAFPVFNCEKEKDHEFIQRIVNESDFLKKNYKKYGRRNIALTTTAPTGSVSIMTQTTSGIEPAFMLSYTRRRKINPDDEGARVDFVDELGDRWQEYTIYHHKFKQWMEITGKTKQEDSPYYGGLANDIDWVSSVKLQAAAQKWVCHAISRTCNLPNDVAYETVGKIYMEAWKSGCKGFTVYRDGCRSGVLVSEQEKEENATIFSQNHAPRRPEELPCDIHQVKIKGEAWTILVGLMDGKPYEVFGGLSSMIEIPKKYKDGILIKHPRKSMVSKYDLLLDHDNDDNSMRVKDVVKVFENPTHGAFTRVLSLSLRHGAPLHFVCEQLQKDDKDSDMFSFSKVISRVLKQYIQDGTKASGECPECHADSIIYQEGCLKCSACGFAKCG